MFRRAANLLSVSLSRPPDRTCRRPPGRPRNKWLDQLRNDSTRPTGDLWRRAVDRGHRGATTRRPSPATRTCWWGGWGGNLLSLTIDYTVIYSNHTVARISIQTAWSAFSGTGLCSYRVRGVDGSCAKHSTVESYTVVMLLTLIPIISISFPSPTLFHSRHKTFLFCKSFPLQPFFFFFRTD